MTQNPAKQPKPLLTKGIILFVCGLLINLVFQVIGIGGLLRELSRLMVIIGIALAVIGLLVKKR